MSVENVSPQEDVTWDAQRSAHSAKCISICSMQLNREMAHIRVFSEKIAEFISVDQ